MVSADKQRIYAGIHGGGLVAVNLRTNEVSEVKNGNIQFENDVYSLVYDASNTLWIGTLNGIYTYNEQTKQIVKQNVSKLTSDYCYYLKFDSKQRLWIGTDRSLIVYNPKTKYARRFSSVEYNETKTTGVVNSIYEDSHKRLWVCTNSGLSLYKGNGKFKTFLTENGLPTNVIYGILEDSYGNTGLVRITGSLATILRKICSGIIRKLMACLSINSTNTLFVKLQMGKCILVD